MRESFQGTVVDSNCKTNSERLDFKSKVDRCVRVMVRGAILLDRANNNYDSSQNQGAGYHSIPNHRIPRNSRRQLSIPLPCPQLPPPSYTVFAITHQCSSPMEDFQLGISPASKEPQDNLLSTDISTRKKARIQKLSTMRAGSTPYCLRLEPRS
jgi:hypothetical protein